MNTELYFSFGSNMDRDQMKKRTPSAEFVAIGHVPDHDLVFNRRGSYRPGGVASIVPCQGVDTYGVVWAVSPNELKKMDQIEDPKAYERVRKVVVTSNGDKLACNVYVAFPEGEIAPDQEYLELVIHAAEAAGLPESWIARIKRYRSGAAYD
jgi:hypothetical protein